MKQYRIGRNHDNDIVLNYPQVSGNHADIIVGDNGLITLTDHSTNGTYVNGQKIYNQSVNIRRGDTVNFANQANLDWGQIFSSGTQMMGDKFNATARMESSPHQQQPQAQGNYQQYQHYGENKPVAPFSVVSLILGICSLCIPYVCFATSIIGIVLSSIGMSKIKNNTSAYDKVGMLRAGFIMSIIGASFWLILLISIGEAL